MSEEWGPLNGNFGISKIPCDSERIKAGKNAPSLIRDLPKQFSFQNIFIRLFLAPLYRKSITYLRRS